MVLTEAELRVLSHGGLDDLAWAEVLATAKKMHWEDLSEKARVVTPGGRVGNDARHGSRSNGENWIEKTPAGELPPYIRTVRNALMRNGMAEGRATATAVASMKRWAAGLGNVSAAVQAAAAKAVAQWEALKASRHAKSLQERIEDIKGTPGFDATELVKRTYEALGVIVTEQDTEEKDESMELEHKNVGVSGFKVLDPETGIVETIVSVTGLRDNVNDNILPGAYAKTLVKRIPKGVWSHDWDTPISKTLEAKELLPGDAELPKTMRNGEAWPEGAGGLKIKTQFNLETQRGREAFSDVRFFGEEQEWSIGYNVPTGGAKMDSKTGVREISTIELYEYSPVLFGAMPNAVTTSVKTAQEAFKVLVKSGHAQEWTLTEEANTTKDDPGVEVTEEGTGTTDDGDDTPDPKKTKKPEETDDEEETTLTADDDDEPENKAGRVLSSGNMKLVEEAIKALTSLLNSAQPSDATQQTKDVFDSVTDAITTKGIEHTELKGAAVQFDAAYRDSDTAALDTAADSILTIIESELTKVDPATKDALRDIAAVLGDFLDDAEDGGDGTGGGDGGSGGDEKTDVVDTEIKELKIDGVVIDMKELELDFDINEGDEAEVASIFVK